MTIIKALQCGIDGCTTSKLKRHTHTYGDLRNFGDRALIEQYRVFAQMRGEPIAIPGGSADDMSHYLRNQVKQGNKEAAEFRKRISEEYEAMKKDKKQKPDQKEAERRAREHMKKKFKWKK